jgi:hypothetical protein
MLLYPSVGTGNGDVYYRAGVTVETCDLSTEHSAIPVCSGLLLAVLLIHRPVLSTYFFSNYHEVEHEKGKRGDVIAWAVMTALTQ